MWVEYNVNPVNKRVGDCVIRAISYSLGQSWEDTYADLFAKGLSMHDMPNANIVWGAYLRDKGYSREAIPNTCPDCYTVKDFCEEHPKGKYLLALDGHLIAVENGNYIDTWDSGNEIPIYYWRKN
jgi:hypothetical protein